MSAEATADDIDNVLEPDGHEPPKKKGLTGKKIVLFIVLPVLLLVGGGVGVMMSGILGGGAAEDAKKTAAEESDKPAKAVFFDLPEMLVNLNATGRRPIYLKILVSLELSHMEDSAHLRQVMPRVIDTFQVYLRELRLDDLRGSAGIYQLREELLARVNAAAHPVQVKEVLFKEMLIQ